MTTANKKRVQLLILLLVILAVTLAVGFRANRPAAVSNTPVDGEQKPATTLPVTSDARIRLDLLGPAKPSADLGKNNVFQYRTRPVEPFGPNGKPAGIAAAPPPPPPPPVRVGPITPAGPPPPPPIGLKYIGFIHSGKSLTAVLADNNNQHVFNAVEGDFLMGRYRLVRITESSVEIEDTEYSRHQTLAVEKQ